MRKYNKRIFAVFYDVIVALTLKREFFYINKTLLSVFFQVL